MSNSIRAAVVVAAGLLIGAAAPAAAQSKGVDLTAGYQFQRVSCDGCDSLNIPLGFSVDVAGDINPMFQWVGDLDWGHKSFEGDETSSITLFGAGGRYNIMSSGMAKPFVQVLIGIAHSKDEAGNLSFSSNDFAFGVDGGFAYPVNPKTSLVGMIGFRHVSGDGGSSNVVPRLVIAGRWKLGSQ